MVRCVNLRLTVGMAPNRTTTSGVSEALKERVGRLRSLLADHLVKWSFTIPDEKGVRGRNVFSGRSGLWQ